MSPLPGNHPGNQVSQGPPVARIVFLVVICAITLFGIVSLGKLGEYLPSHEIMVIQAPFSGKLSVYTEPGMYWQGYGTVTKYPRRTQVWFSSRKDQNNKVDESLPVRFNDNGKALLSIGISWAMPTDQAHVIALQKSYGSADAIQKQLIEPVVQKAAFAVGPLMSSQESAAARRNDLFQFLEDQIQNGVFKTETLQEKQLDPMTGQPKTVSVVRVVTDKQGQIVRADDSTLREFGVRVFNPVINDVAYAKEVEEQIQAQQKLTMAIQTSIAEAKRSEQRVITVQKDGEADAAKAKWAQEVLKATAVTAAQQQLEVNTLNAKAAEQFKAQQILEGQGQAEKRRLVMAADGALDKKLETYVTVQNRWAQAFENFKGQLVPQVVTGGGTGGGNAALGFMELIGIKAARDLAVDLRAGHAKE